MEIWATQFFQDRSRVYIISVNKTKVNKASVAIGLRSWDECACDRSGKYKREDIFFPSCLCNISNNMPLNSLNDIKHCLTESTNEQCGERLLSGWCAYQAGTLMFIPGSLPGTHRTETRRARD